MTDFIVNSDQSKAEFDEIMSQLYDKHKFLRIQVKTGRQRTSAQNRALHKYFQMLADALNDAGYDMQQTLRHDAEIPWSPEMVKELLWRPLQKAVLDKESTTEAHRGEYSKVYDVLNRHLSSKLGIHVPWPHIE